MDELTCIKCNTTKLKKDFTKSKNTKAGVRNTCKDCSNGYFREYNKKKKVANDDRTKIYFAHKLANIKDQDRRRFPGVDTELTVDDLIEVYTRCEGRCVYSNKKLNSKGKGNIFNTVSFDRIDNSLPHTKENLQLTSIYMNRKRGSTTHEDFLKAWTYD